MERNEETLRGLCDSNKTSNIFVSRVPARETGWGLGAVLLRKCSTT